MPKPYVRKMPATWWLKQPAYFYFMLREFTAVFVALYCVVLLMLLYRLKQGGESYQEFVEHYLMNGWSVGLHFIALLFAAYHSITWFNLTPKVMVIRLGEEKVPPILLVLGNYVAWLLLSAGLIWLVFH